MTSPGHGAVRGSQDSTPTPETLLTENISPSRAELLPTRLPSVFTLSQTRTPASFQNASNIKEIYLQKKKKNHTPIPQNASVWIYLVKPWECHWYLHSPKTTENAGPEDYMCPSSSERSQEHVAQSIPLGCGLRHGVGLHQTRLNLAN